jgi:hypothetical protein
MDTNTKLIEALQNLMGLYDTPVERMRRGDDEFYKEAMQIARQALNDAGAKTKEQQMKNNNSLLGIDECPDIYGCRNLKPVECNNAQARAAYANGVRVFIIIENVLCEINKNSILYDCDHGKYYIPQGIGTENDSFKKFIK